MFGNLRDGVGNAFFGIVGARRAKLGKLDGAGDRPDPGSKIFRTELCARDLANVVVHIG